MPLSGPALNDPSRNSALAGTTLLKWEGADPKGKEKTSAGQEIAVPATELSAVFLIIKKGGGREESGCFRYYLHDRRQQAGWFCPGRAVKEDSAPP